MKLDPATKEKFMKLQKLKKLGFCCIGAVVLSAGMLFAG
jgi:hypothetical protein